MNYLAHLHLAKMTHTSLLGNFLGDFVKGTRLDTLPADLRHGVRLHRKVDVITDTHVDIVALKQKFPRDIRRMAGVVMDIYFDHILCRRWSDFSSESLSALLRRFYAELDAFDEHVSARFQRVRQSLLDSHWLDNYVHQKTCLTAFRSIEQRLGQRVIFAQRAYQFVTQSDEMIEQSFRQFYPQLIDDADSVAKQLD